MAYTNDGSSDVSTIRVMIYDLTDESSPTRGTDYYYEDAEIESALDQNADDLNGTAADLARGLALKFAREAQEIGLGSGDIKIKWERSKFYAMIADQYESKSNSDVAEYIDGTNIDYGGSGSDNTEYIGDI